MVRRMGTARKTGTHESMRWRVTGWWIVKAEQMTVNKSHGRPIMSSLVHRYAALTCQHLTDTDVMRIQMIYTGFNGYEIITAPSMPSQIITLALSCTTQCTPQHSVTLWRVTITEPVSAA